jgi:hypothetical protein
MPKIEIRKPIVNGLFALIPLTRGYQAIIDVESLELVSAYNWYAVRNKAIIYAARTTIIGGKKKTIFMHREVISTPKDMHTDHIDGNGLNNTRANLRHVTHNENMQNRSNLSSNTSGIKGVHFDKKANRWIAQIRVNKKRIYLGCFVSAADAKTAYASASKKYHGKFGRLE